MQVRSDQSEQVRVRRQITAAVEGRRPRRRRRPGRGVPPPSGPRLQFQRDILRLVDRVGKELTKVLAPLLAEVNTDTRMDAPADRVRTAVQRVTEQLPEFEAEIRVVSRRAVTGVSTANRRSLNQLLERTVGVGLSEAESFIEGTLTNALERSVDLITNLLSDEVTDVQDTIADGFRAGRRSESIARDLRDRLDISRRRAQLIARDQVATLNSELTRQRQTHMGVTHYIWRTSGDERVREEHADLDGQRFSWREGSPEGHPGEPINCRCTAEPDLDALTG